MMLKSPRSYLRSLTSVIKLRKAKKTRELGSDRPCWPTSDASKIHKQLENEKITNG